LDNGGAIFFMTRKKVFAITALSIVGTLFLVVVGGLAAISIFSPGPRSLGVTNGKLSECPPSPNCVCSQTSDKGHQIDAIGYTGDGKQALSRLKQVIQSMPRTRIVTDRIDYLHAEFTSLLFRFVDDLELSLDEPAHLIHVRSASRAGYGDMDVNRHRVEAIRAAFGK